jgi:hypothetical protein
MNLYTILLAFLPVVGVNDAGYEEFIDNSDRFLSAYVTSGRVDYARIKSQSDEIHRLYEYIGNADLSGLEEQERKAFYINAYNLIVIYQVSSYYPLKSPMDASGFFDGVKHRVAGEMLTLNALEIKKLLIPYKDARIHFALACAANSCPKLASFAYQPDRLDQQLDQRTREAINDENWLMVDAVNKKVAISKIFQWYKKDFDEYSGSVLAFINAFRKTPVPAGYSMEFYEYDWGLNED